MGNESFATSLNELISIFTVTTSRMGYNERTNCQGLFDVDYARFVPSMNINVAENATVSTAAISVMAGTC